MTLYRAGSNAEAVRALIRAAENGKQVAVSIELKARFDEANNIAWARALEHAGAHVFYGDAVMKTHAKTVLVVRREGSELRRYVHLSTGNYNAGTAKLYTDLGLLTCDPQLGEDVSELFNSLSGFSKKSRYRKLAVAPHGLIDAIVAKIDEQARRARAGQPARIFAKMNSLVDVRVIRALYAASIAGRQHRSGGARDLLPGARPGRGLGQHPGSLHASDASSSTSASSSSGPKARRPSSCLRPTGCRATSIAGSRPCFPSSRTS